MSFFKRKMSWPINLMIQDYSDSLRFTNISALCLLNVIFWNIAAELQSAFFIVNNRYLLMHYLQLKDLFMYYLQWNTSKHCNLAHLNKKDVTGNFKKGHKLKYLSDSYNIMHQEAFIKYFLLILNYFSIFEMKPLDIRIGQ